MVSWPETRYRVAMSRSHLGCAGLVSSVGSGIGLSCGGGGRAAGEQFCQQWAAAFCQRLYACTPVDQRGSGLPGRVVRIAMHSGLERHLRQSASTGQTFDVNCSGGVHVNTAAKSACLDELASITCDDFSSPNYTSVCTQVCPAARAPGAPAGDREQHGRHRRNAAEPLAGRVAPAAPGHRRNRRRHGDRLRHRRAVRRRPVGTWSFTTECVDLGELALRCSSSFTAPTPR